MMVHTMQISLLTQLTYLIYCDRKYSVHQQTCIFFMLGSMVMHSVSTQTVVRYFESPAEIQQTAATFQHPVNLEWTLVYVVHALCYSH